MASPDALFPPGLFPPQPPAVIPAAAPAQAPPNGAMPASLEGIVRLAQQQNYSDVHLGVGEEPRYRARGDMLRTGWPITDSATFHAWLKEMLSPSQIDQFLKTKDFDGSHAFPFVRVRINLMDSLRGPAMVLRLIPQTIASLDELGLPAVLRELCERPKGLVLVTGPTGSGKSTTLAAMIDWINSTMQRHILTIEDPVEFVHQSRESLIRHREVGQHTRQFHSALRAALREDPDVILIGEIRDQDTLATALEASQTGHLVFGTLHTNSAVRTVERIHQGKVVIDLDGDTVAAFRGDRQDLEEMIGNLIDNAAVHGGGRVFVTIVADAPMLRVMVEDDGPGIPEIKRSLLFERGERLDTDKPGTGLGLAIVKDVAELYGGSVVLADSEDLGGLMVTLSLPMAD
jgi:twitching motility protein PilT